MLRLVAIEPDMALNVGAMLRVCACFGARFELIEPCGFAFSIRAVRRSAMDYAKVVEIVRHDSWRAFVDREGGVGAAARRDGAGRSRRVLLTTSGDVSLWDWRFAPGDAVMVGSESAGAPEPAHQAADARVRVPIAAEARSLNVAVAAGVALAEARRQLRAAATPAAP